MIPVSQRDEYQNLTIPKLLAAKPSQIKSTLSDRNRYQSRQKPNTDRSHHRQKRQNLVDLDEKTSDLVGF
ncbi:hypothetical protein M752DRAFT_37271 [Aspergillus phoenicis ATCC 13157]|uniref:Uncharacterized protein n=1 Tax=Aspergillus phoenicis ATCC 13157 TaxID=1353007 RepID=A0A370PF19_ASPPH|nr:hypothetical protein M752DRAFT_37271 [Aspergillus phoenicis ATCC 13157]